MFRDYTNGKEVMLKFEWIEQIMLANCCSKAKANGIFKRLVEAGKLWEVEGY